MSRPLAVILATGVALFGAAAAHAGTHWSVSVNVPVAGVMVTNGGGYYVSEPQPVYYAPAPVVRYVPAPVYVAPPAYVAPQVVYFNEQPVYTAPYRAEPFRDVRWAQHREFERDRWEHARHERAERGWGRDYDGWAGGGEHRRRHD